MRRTLLFALFVISVMLLCGASSGVPNDYATSTSGGAPKPTTPTPPDQLGIQAPTDIDMTASSQAPSTRERSQNFMMADQSSAYAAAPQVAMGATSNKAVYQMILPPGGTASNSLYVSYAPRTVASCNLYANLPLWMNTKGRGNIWFYEWYPNGMLDTQYAGNVYYPGWYKRWFFADTPGWHILQYYCGGWSNYAYIYVNGPGGYWVNPYPSSYSSPNPYPYSQGQVTYTFPSTGHTYYSYKSSTTYG
ncbi:Uncharacterised protein [uncultured archaeon]|nr:Uncharacterised protein [uncultured archaeon]